MSLSNSIVNASVASAMSTTNGPATLNAPVKDETKLTVASGTASGQCDLLYSARRLVSAGTPDVIDLNALTDPTGAAVNFARVNVVKVTNKSATAGQILTVGGGSAPASTTLGATLNVNGCTMLFVDTGTGIVVTNTTADKLTITAAAGTNVPYDITILGRSV